MSVAGHIRFRLLDGTRLERIQHGIVHYLPALIFAGFGILVVLATEVLWPKVGWIGTYGPNVASSFLELFIGAGFIQWLVERQRAPMVKYAHQRVRSLLDALVSVMQELVDEGPAHKDGEVMSLRELIRRWNADLEKTDFEHAAERHGPLRSTLERVSDDIVDVRRQYLEAANMIGTYCDPRLTAALDELINGRRQRRVWDALRQDLRDAPELGWIYGRESIMAFSSAVSECLKAYDDTRTEDPVTVLALKPSRSPAGRGRPGDGAGPP